MEDPLAEQCTKENLNHHLESFFYQLKTATGDDYKATTLRTAFSALHRYFLACERPGGDRIDVWNSEEFQGARTILDRRMKDLQDMGKGGNTPATSILPEEMNAMLALCHPSTPEGLLRRVYLHVATYFVERGGSPYELLLSQLERCTTADGRVYFKRTQQKDNHHQSGIKGELALRENIVPPDPLGTEGPVYDIELYLGKRQDVDIPYFFVAVNNHAAIRKGVWYKNQRVGKNKLARILRDCAQQANLENWESRRIVPQSCRGSAVNHTVFQEELNLNT